jgi:hypothetical protein
MNGTDRFAAETAVRHVLSADRQPRLLFVLLSCAALTSSWTGFRIVGLNLADFFLIGALIYSLAIGSFGRTRLPVPWQFLVLPAVILLLMTRDALFYDRLPFQAITAAQYTTGDALGQTVGGSGTFLIRVVLSWTAVGIAVGAFRQSQRHLLAIAGVWVAGTAVSVGWAVAQTTLALPDLPFVYHIDSATRAVGLANHPNSLAETIGTALPLAVYCAIGPRANAFRRIVGFVLLIAATWALFLSGSRAGLAVGVFALALSVVIRLIWSGKGVWGVPLGLLTVVGGIVWLPRVWATTRFSQGSAQISDSERVDALKQGLSLFAQHPLGGSGLSIWLGEMVPLILLAGGGAILFFAFYSSIMSVFVRLWSGRRNEFMMQLVCSCAVVLVFGLLNNGLVERYLYWPFVIGFYWVSHIIASERARIRVDSSAQ